MNIRQLEHFIAIVEHGSYRAAAISLGVTQPALTKSIAGLESELSVTLLSRSRGKAASLTPFGRIIYERGVKMLEDLGATRRAVELLRDGYAGDVRIGFSTAISAASIAEVSCTLQAKLPTSMIHIRTGLQHELLPRLRTNQLDLLMISGLNQASAEDLSAVTLWQDPFQVFIGASHSLAGQSIYDRAWAQTYPWLSSERLVSTDSQAAKYLGHNEQTVLPSKFDVFDPAIIAQILCRQDYMSAWPSRSFEQEVARGTLHAMTIPPVEDQHWISETYLVSLRGVIMTPSVQAAWRAIQAMDFADRLSLAE
ncbi:MAG: hypothetical protein Hens3KO_28990 [Henriciella sp.]